MANKHNADCRHHIPKMKFKVQNWPEYEAVPRRRGTLTLWVEGTALAQGFVPIRQPCQACLMRTEQKPMNETLRRAFKRLHYPIEVILVCVRWYVAYPLSLRHLEAMMAERGVAVDHSEVAPFVWTESVDS